MSDKQQLAEAVRAACIKAALEAYEEGGMLGLCAEGRWEYAVSAMRQFDIKNILIPNDLPDKAGKSLSHMLSKKPNDYSHT